MSAGAPHGHDVLRSSHQTDATGCKQVVKFLFGCRLFADIFMKMLEFLLI